MKTTINRVARMTIEEFAEEHDLEMVVNERIHCIGTPQQFYAKFKGAEIAEGGCLISNFGNGRTPEEAISNYAEGISGKLIVFDAFVKEKRKEIQVPILITEEPTN